MHWLTHRDGPGSGCGGCSWRPGAVPAGTRDRRAGRLGDRRGRQRRPRDRIRRPGQPSRSGRHTAADRRWRGWPRHRAGGGAGWNEGRGRGAGRAAEGRRRRVRPGARARRVGQRGRDRACLVDRLRLAGVVAAGRASARQQLQPAPPVAAGAARRRPGFRRHGRPVHRHRAGLHPRRQIPGVLVDAQLRSDLRRALLRPDVSVWGQALPAASRRDDSVTLRTRTRRAAHRRARGRTRGGLGG